MEDALVHGRVIEVYDIFGLNPCFNGRCTRTVFKLYSYV